MRNLWKLGTLMPLLATLFAAAGVGYALVTPNLYDVSAEVLLRRTQVEPMEGASEAAKNRWVWVRDGLALRQELTSDETLALVLKDVPALQARQEAFAAKAKAKELAEADQELLFLEALRKQITVVFDGGDENVYTISIRDKEPKVAREVVEELIVQMKRLAVDEAAEARRQAVDAITQKALAGDAGPGSKFVGVTTGRGKDRLDDYRVLLQARDELYKTEDQARVRVLKHPVRADLAWPRIPILVIVGALLGCVVALLIDLKRTGGFQRLLSPVNA